MTQQLNPADQRILEITKDLCQKLNISGVKPDWVAWHGYAPGGSFLTGRLMTVPFDGCVFDDNTIVLAEGFRDQLEPEDWGPLIAAELVYKERFQGKLWGYLLSRVPLPTVLSIVVSILLWLFGIVNLNGAYTGTRGGSVPLIGVFFTAWTLASIFLVFPSYFIIGLPYSKNLRLAADKDAVQVIGTAQFLSSLTKVGNLIPKLMVGKRPDSRYPYGRPSIRRRIETIQSSSQTLN